ncbi:hypothetical protein KR032_008541, partial [Drosophila birchii]
GRGNRNDGCPECGYGVIEDAEHVFFECRRFDEGREELEVAAGTDIRPDTLVQLMLAEPKVWDAAAKFSAQLMKALRSQERARKERTG